MGYYRVYINSYKPITTHSSPSIPNKKTCLTRKLGRFTIIAGCRLDEDMLQDKQHCEDVHHRAYLIEIATDEVNDNIGNHTKENTVRDRVCQWHHNDADKR